ncbi:MAG: hypothetical protein IPP69_14915 [Flavobacteriales bacterium]|nr:hypothetical protein [Flavobacteriales bacterium]
MIVLIINLWFQDFSPSFFLDKKGAKKIKAVEKIQEILNISGQIDPKLLVVSKNGASTFYTPFYLDILKLLVAVALCPLMLGFLRIFSKRQHQHEVFRQEINGVLIFLFPFYLGY